MTRTLARSALVALCAAAFADRAHAAGFLIYDLSGEALGKGSAVSASTTEPAAVFFNPAALAFTEGYQVSATSVVIHNRNSFTPANGGPKVKGNPGTYLAPNVFASARLTPRAAIGFGVYPAFGLGIEWPSDWLGRRDAIKAEIQTIDMNPTLAVQLWRDKLSLAVGYNVVRATVDLTNGLPDTVGGTVRVGGATFGQGWNAALMYRPLPDYLHFAVTYRSRVTLDFSGRADFEPSPEFARSLPDQGGKASITLPDIFTFGVAWKPIPTLTLNFDPHYVLWSTYDELRLDFETAPDEVLIRKNKNVFTLRFGADWQTPAPGLTLRGGFIYDQNPAPAEYLAPSLPDANRVDFGLGVGYRHGRWSADLGYLLVYFLPVESKTGREGPVGKYRTIAHLFGLTLTARFGAGAAGQ